MHLNDWELDDIKIKMKDMSLFDLQTLFIKKHNEYRDFILLYLELLNKESKEKLETKAELIQKECIVISLKMSELLTGKKL